MEFKKIPDCISSKGYTYEISQDFIVRSISKKGVSKILKSEHPQININNKLVGFHRAILRTIIDIPNDIVIDHIDDIKTNARLGNLQILTHSENIKKRHLTSYTSSVASFVDKKHEISSHTNKESAIEYVRHRGYPEASLAELNVELMFLRICDIPAVIYGRTWFPAHFVKC